MSGPRFGTAGLSDSYKAQKHKDMLQMPGYMQSFGLDAFEYQCGHGVRIAPEKAAALKAGAEQAGILFSLHAPYYMSPTNPDEEKQEACVRYMLQSAEAVTALGGRRVVFHPGVGGKTPEERAAALQTAADCLQRMRAALDAEGFAEVNICPETMGKPVQLGTVDEVVALCRADSRHIPCLDLGHINAREQGALRGESDFAAVLDKLAALGDERARCFHVHFSKIEYGAGGEKRHLTFSDQAFGPRFEPFLNLCAKRGLAPVIICESRGTQAEDAAAMKKYYLRQKPRKEAGNDE